MSGEHWQKEPEAHDYPAAETYLSLLCDPLVAHKLAQRLAAAPTVIYDAKDILRASGLALLARDNAHVAKDLDKVAHGKHLSPVLLVRGRLDKRRALVVADGYHRICASYWIDENSPIPCRVVDASP